MFILASPSGKQQQGTVNEKETTDVVGDAELPFWVQKENSQWMDPDEFFIFEARAVISLTDRRIFWEMTRVRFVLLI